MYMVPSSSPTANTPGWAMRGVSAGMPSRGAQNRCHLRCWRCRGSSPVSVQARGQTADAPLARSSARSPAATRDSTTPASCPRARSGTRGGWIPSLRPTGKEETACESREAAVGTARGARGSPGPVTRTLCCTAEHEGVWVVRRPGDAGGRGVQGDVVQPDLLVDVPHAEVGVDGARDEQALVMRRPGAMGTRQRPPAGIDSC